MSIYPKHKSGIITKHTISSTHVYLSTPHKWSHNNRTLSRNSYEQTLQYALCTQVGHWSLPVMMMDCIVHNKSLVTPSTMVSVVGMERGDVHTHVQLMLRIQPGRRSSMCGHSSVWVRMCVVRLPRVMNRTEKNWQRCPFETPWIFMCMR